MTLIRTLLMATFVAACSNDSDEPRGDDAPDSGGFREEPDRPAAPSTDGTDGGRVDPSAPASSCKRGVAYGHHSKGDMQALSKGVSWWYNWAFEPDPGVKDDYRALGVDYVPMVWGGKVDATQVQKEAPQGVTALLGFNEPNFGAQANMSATAAAALWPKVVAAANARGIGTLVSPAVNFCGGDCNETDPFKYLENFFAACKDCRVDAIAIHIYVGCKGENGNHAQWLINHIKKYEQTFTQPLWLTEFACDDAKNADEQRAFMLDAVTYLESDPRIARYAWFAGRADNVPYVDLLGDDGVLTPLGQAYVDAPHDASCER